VIPRLLFLALLAAASLACSSSSGSPSASPTSVSPSSTAAPSTTLGTDGGKLFAAKCAGCHGSSGEGNLGPALSGVADRMSEADQIEVVSHGRGTMLAFSPALSDEQIAAVVAYTRTQLPPAAAGAG
jgi:mono/diheme cytochrome c family protein